MELNVSSAEPDYVLSDSVSDLEEKEISDDDDRNHKHRRREIQSQSLEKDSLDEVLTRPYRKRSRPLDNGHPYREGDSQPSGNWKNYTPPEKDLSAKFEKRHPGIASLSRSPLDINQRIRSNQSFPTDSGFGRGRGRESNSWSQRDSRFSSVDIASQLIQQRSVPPSLFAGRVPNVVNGQSASWSAFGLLPGMGNGSLDLLHSLGWQGTLRQPVNSSLHVGIPRQRCRDFEERGFCLRGDMCPMEHGINRIVVEDVQSLSQFNLPVSLPNAHLLGTPCPLPSLNATSSTLINIKGLPGKSSESGTDGDGLGVRNNTFSGPPAAAGADIYDPDQPLWTDGGPKTSNALVSLNTSITDETASLLDAKPSDGHHVGLSDNFDNEGLVRSAGAVTDSQSTNFSVWGRIGNSKIGPEREDKVESIHVSSKCAGSETKQEPLNHSQGGSCQRKYINMHESGPQAIDLPPNERSDTTRNIRRPSQKALRTLFVNGIPLENNQREALLSHFQKFGEVIDIYIPLSSGRAFVQFSKSEEAEAALKSPDAVMGNRFIKLWWANRDSIPDDGMGGRSGVAVASAPPYLSAANKVKDKLVSGASMGSTANVSVAPSSSSDQPKGLVAPDSLQKKLQSLGLLKEELRKKQEMLDKNRNDFRLQLDKLEKQTIGVKGEAITEKAVKRAKVGTPTDNVKGSRQTYNSPSTVLSSQKAELMTDNSKCTENVSPHGSEANSTAALQESSNMTRSVCPLAPLGTPFLNRFKLDNRPTAFKIFPPLPIGLANVTALKEHFSTFGDLSTVLLEDLEPQDDDNGSEESKRSAHISFTARASADRAFLNGKCWQGHNLKFAWLASSNNSSKDTGGQESPLSSSEVHSDANVKHSEEAASAGSQEAAPSGNRESEILEITERVELDKEPDESFQSSSKI